MASYLIKHPDEFRTHVKNELWTTITKNQPTITELSAINLERGIYNFAVKEASIKKIIKSWDNPSFRQLYADKLRTTYFNLSPTLLEQVAKGEIKSRDIPFMTHQELDSEKWTHLLDAKAKRDDSRINPVQQMSGESVFSCKKCKSKNCTYYELQIRSADEPATCFITCLDCGKNWRQ